jgi:hypothetical protein
MHKWLFLLAFIGGCHTQVGINQQQVNHKPTVEYEAETPFVLKQVERNALVFESENGFAVMRGFHIDKKLIGGVYYFTKKDGVVKSIRFVGELAPFPRDTYEKN